jgi:hypothetical protein
MCGRIIQVLMILRYSKDFALSLIWPYKLEDAMGYSRVYLLYPETNLNKNQVIRLDNTSKAPPNHRLKAN